MSDKPELRPEQKMILVMAKVLRAPAHGFEDNPGPYVLKPRGTVKFDMPKP